MNTKTFLTVIAWASLAAGLWFSIYAWATEDAFSQMKQKEVMKTAAAEMDRSQIEGLIKDLDTKYQHAVKNNDAETMATILADDFVLVTGKGKVFSKADLLSEARARTTLYEHQEDTQQTVRIWGDTAVITALLWEKGVTDGKAFDKKLWFSDVYKLTPAGWKYVFAQASIPLPDGE